MTRLLALALTAALSLIAVPAIAQVPTNQPCTNAAGKQVVTIDDGYEGSVDTPVGVLGAGPTVSGGSYLIDLAGTPVGTTKSVTATVSWTNGVFDDLTDYDMVVNGETYNATDTSEVASLTLGHCKTVTIDEIYSYTGTPADSLTVSVEISSFGF